MTNDLLVVKVALNPSPTNLPFKITGEVFLAPLAVGQRAYVMVRALTFSLNIFSETTYRILMKFHRNVPAMVLFRIS